MCVYLLQFIPKVIIVSLIYNLNQLIVYTKCIYVWEQLWLFNGIRPPVEDLPNTQTW